MPFNPCCPVLIYGERGSFRHWFQFAVPRLTIQLRLVSHHPSVGAGAEDDTQLGHSTTPRLCFLSSTPLTSLCITTRFPCLFACSVASLCHLVPLYFEISLMLTYVSFFLVHLTPAGLANMTNITEHILAHRHVVKM